MTHEEYWKLPRKQKAKVVSEQLRKEYPYVETPLIHSNAFELLVATMLSPQTLDSTTNKKTPALFKKYPTPRALAKANINDVIELIKGVNYYRTKARNIINMANILINKHNGRVPHTMEKLDAIPGVGRKIANVIISEWFAKHEGIEEVGFVIDTHVLRCSRMLGLTMHRTPNKVEKDLMELFPKSEWRETCLRLIFHGREVNKSRGADYSKHPFWKKIYIGPRAVKK